jgi:hypothetical protein
MDAGHFDVNSLEIKSAIANFNSSSVASSSPQYLFNSRLPIRALQAIFGRSRNRSCCRRRANTTRSRIWADASPVRSLVISVDLGAPSAIFTPLLIRI